LWANLLDYCVPGGAVFQAARPASQLAARVMGTPALSLGWRRLCVLLIMA